MEKKPEKKNYPDLASKLDQILASGTILETNQAKELLNEILGSKSDY